MSAEIKLRLPLPPSTNSLHVGNSDGGKHRSKSYSRWLSQAGLIARSQMIGKHGFGKADVVVDVTCQVPLDRKGRPIPCDVDNMTKATLDLMQAIGVYANDRTVEELRVRRYRGDQRFGYDMDVTVNLLDDEQESLF